MSSRIITAILAAQQTALNAYWTAHSLPGSPPTLADTNNFMSAQFDTLFVSGTAAVLAAANPVLNVAQLGYETDTISIKIGDGSTAYNSLTYVYRGLPVAGEPSWGSGHWTASTANWPDISRTTETPAAPYTWDLSGAGGCPVGTKAVLIFSELTITTVSAISLFAGVIWDYDYGAHNIHETIRRGLYIECGYKPASAGAEQASALLCRWVKIGPSRKLYVGLITTGGGRTISADYCGYQT